MKNLLLAITLLVSACTNQPTEQTDNGPINPNGDSELALLMREMFEEGMRIKKQVMDGEKPDGLKRFEEIHKAIPTDPKVPGPLFDSFATAYIESIKQLEESNSSTVFKFNSMVDQCMNCHTEFCPGPKKRIKQLYIKD